MSDIVEKIKKLLRMKRGGTPEEIATALRLAQELAEKHDIDLATVNPDDDSPKSERMGHSDPIQSARIQCEVQFAGLVCEQFFNVKVFIRTLDGAWSKTGWRRVYRYALTFVGTEWEREVAAYVLHFLVGHFRREWKTRHGRCRNREAFMWGMYCGLCEKLKERQPPVVHGSDRELVLISGAVARRDYVAKHFGELESHDVEPDTDATVAKWKGFQAGRETEIRPAVGGAQQEGRLMLA